LPEDNQQISFNLNILGNSEDVRPYGDHPEPIRSAIDQIARGLFDSESNHVILTGSKSSGKSMLIKQFAGNVSVYLSHTHINQLFVVRVAPQLQHTIVKIPGGIHTFLNAACNTLQCAPENICLVTENPDFAAYAYTEAPLAKLILEINYTTFMTIKSNEDRGGSKIWGNWSVIDMDRVYLLQEEIEATLNLILAKKLSEEHNINISPELIHQFADEIFTNHPELVFNSDDEGISKEDLGRTNTSVGLWGKTIRKLATNLAYSYKDEFYDTESGDQIVTKIVEETVREFSDEYTEIMEDENFAKIASELPPGMGGMIQVMRMGNNNPMNPNGTDSSRIKSKEVQYTEIDTLERGLRETVFGQDHAITSLADAMTVVSAGLVDAIKPLRVLLFAGPTGVGKTQLALRLSEVVATEPLNVIRLDMSDYSQPQEVSKLLGAPAGYVGSERGGILSTKVQANPHSVIILDEVEKAHPQIWDSFLQIFDAGKITDNHGQMVDFSKTIIIMTSNLGASELKPSELGFSESFLSEKAQEGVVKRAIEKNFKPEFINRIDEIIFFNQLSVDVARQVVRREIGIVGERMTPKGFSLLNYDDNVVDSIINLSDFNKYGARDIQRVVFRNISKPIASKMLSDAHDNKNILLTLTNDKIQVS
jgi:energy-coupling factor transporter ATP-binding protein EcfA2